MQKLCQIEKTTPGQLGISSIELSLQRVESGGELNKTATTDIMNLQVCKTLIFLTLFQLRKTFRCLVAMRLFDQGCWGGCGQRPRDSTLPGFPQVTFLSQNCHNSSKIAILLLGFSSALQHQAASTRSGSIQITLSINFSSFKNALTFFEIAANFFQGHLSPKNFHHKSPLLQRFQITLSIAFANNTTVAQTFDCVTRRVVNKK